MKDTFASHAFGSDTFASGTWTGVGVPLIPPLATCGTDVMALGMAWMTNQLQAHASQPVYYKRGASRIAVCATPGRTLLRLSDEFGATRVEWTDRDFIIPAASLGAFGLPRRNDVIEQNDGTSLHTFEVLPYADEPHWRWCDPYRKMVRIHCKRITTEPV